jgi:hypothetical protein
MPVREYIPFIESGRKFIEFWAKILQMPAVDLTVATKIPDLTLGY